MRATIKEGHVLDVLAYMPAESCHCVVTSPPYFGLRDYGKCTKTQWDAYTNDGQPHNPWHGQLGLEPTIDMYVEHIVEVFRAVRRVLRKDGTCWINVGDSYTGAGHGEAGRSSFQSNNKGSTSVGPTPPIRGLPSKNLIGQPWRIAFALQADGWILRSDIIWAKPNPMPESVTDRPAKSYEHVFLFAKSQRYFYDAEAVREAHKEPWRSTGREEQFGTKDVDAGVNQGFGLSGLKPRQYNPGGRNLRDVWHIPTEAVSDAHFATFPRRLAERCIKAGTSERGCCSKCGAPWARVVETERVATRPGMNCKQERKVDQYDESWHPAANRDNQRHVSVKTTTGWAPGCKCVERYGSDPREIDFYDEIPCTVLDPFCGSGQCGIAATQLGRAFVGIEINPHYAAMTRRRIANPEPLPEIADVPGQMDMFA